MRLLQIVLCIITAFTITFTENVEASNKSVEITKGINGLDKVILHGYKGTSVEVYLYGAHVTSWKNEHNEEMLFVSSKATFNPPKPIRGGIPIIFPQFSNLGPLQSHGFARNRFWTIENNPTPFTPNARNSIFVDLILKSTEEDLKIWPHRFEYRLRITLGPKGELMMASRIRNTDTDGKPFTFTFAHHTYFSVSNISQVRVEGLGKLDYLDNTKNRTRFTEQQDTITFNSETDKIYLSTPSKILILDNKKNRTFVIRKHGIPDAVVWNPWAEKAKKIVDLGENEYTQMLCVEAAAIGKPVTLVPGEEWKVRLELSAVPSRYFSGKSV